LLFWLYLASALVLDMRPANEGLVCAAVGITKAIHRIDRIICLRATAPSQYSLLSAAIGVLGKIKVEGALATTIRIIPIAAVAILIGLSPANGSPACMTEGEARAKFPKAHLVWLGTNHCWTFGLARVHSRRPVPAADPSPRSAPAAEPSPRSVPAAEPSPRSVPAAEPSAVQCQYPPCE
jgi:hypothetical protein